jgi:hypothetical protein
MATTKTAIECVEARKNPDGEADFSAALLTKVREQLRSK